MDRKEWIEKLDAARSRVDPATWMKPPYRVAYYISAHGWGHMIRSLNVIARLARNPEFRLIYVVADFHPSVIRKRLAFLLDEDQLKKIEIRDYAVDFGLSQRDSVSADWERSRANARALLENWDHLVSQEAIWMHTWGFHLVLGDIPAIPCFSASLVDIASFSIGNFTWDWIYNELPDVDDVWLELAYRHRTAYEGSMLWFRLPFTQPGTHPSFGDEWPVGLLAQPGRNRRFELAGQTGAAVRKPWVLLAFTSLDWNAAARRRVAGGFDAEYFVMPPLTWRGRLPSNFRVVRDPSIPYADVVASCDAVLTKPGFGIFSDCVVNRKPAVFTERPEFPEAEILAKDIKRFGVGVEVRRGDFYTGDVGGALDKALSAPWRPKERVPNDAAAQITEILWRYLKMPQDLKTTDIWDPPPADWGDGPGAPEEP